MCVAAAGGVASFYRGSFAWSMAVLLPHMLDTTASGATATFAATYNILQLRHSGVGARSLTMLVRAKLLVFCVDCGFLMIVGAAVVVAAAAVSVLALGFFSSEIVETSGGVRIWGGKDVPSQLPFHASFLYSRNVVNLLSLFTVPAKDDQKVAFNLDFEDEIINGAAVTHGGSRRGAK